jgi:acyl-coenzyme A synthetase/AMP-(fatty) acid ligase
VRGYRRSGSRPRAGRQGNRRPDKGLYSLRRTHKELQDFVKKTTAPYKYPRIIEYVEFLPKTISGKIMRKDIRAADKNRQVVDG